MFIIFYYVYICIYHIPRASSQASNFSPKKVCFGGAKGATNFTPLRILQVLCIYIYDIHTCIYNNILHTYIYRYMYTNIYKAHAKIRQYPQDTLIFLAGTNQKVDATFHHMTTKEKMHVRWKNAERNGGFMSKSRSLAAEKILPWNCRRFSPNMSRCFFSVELTLSSLKNRMCPDSIRSPPH